ncbi:MAG: nuclear transport factor 2 family protein [Chitinophagaceae bacterium]|nr:nuclear transport factor 2 family protein [Chitinophagaceae bacterium]
MKTTIVALQFFLMVVGTTTAFCQENVEVQIKKMDSLMERAWLRGDTIELLSKYWSPKLVVNNPLNKVVTVDIIKKIVKGGTMTPVSSERTIEKVTIIDNVAIAMGAEMAVPSQGNIYAGKKTFSRFTNVWMKTEVGWRMIARQSTIIKVEE